MSRDNDVDVAVKKELRRRGFRRFLVRVGLVFGFVLGGLGGAAAPPRSTYTHALLRHAGVERDLAVVVAEEVEAGAVAATLAAAGGSLVRGVTLFDVYRGAPLEPSEKSLAWRLAVRADDRALDDGEVDELMGRLVAAVADAHGGRLRA